MLSSQLKRKPLFIFGTPVTSMHQNDVEPGFTCTTENAISGVTFAVHSGTLPTGITFNSSSGVFAGTPTQAGTFADIVLKATDGKARVAYLAAFTLTVTAAPTFAVENQTAYFGALTAASAGGYSVIANNTIAAASITGGDASGHWQISSAGVITPTSTGVSASFSGAPYSLACSFTDTLDEVDTATITVNITSNAYSVSSATEFNTAITALGTPASLAGARSILCRPGSYGNITSLSGKAFANRVTVAPHTGQSTAPTFGRISLNAGVTKVTLSGLEIFSDWTSADTGGTVAIIRADLSTDCIIDDCDISSTPLASITMQQPPHTLHGVGTMSINAHTNLTVSNCFIHEVDLPVRLKGTGATVSWNTFENCFRSFGEFYGDCSNGAYENNRGIGVWANGSVDSGNPHSSLLGWTPFSNVDVDTFNVEGNVLVVGTNRFDAFADINAFATGPKMNDTNDGYGYINFTIKSNLLVCNANIGFEFAFATDCEMAYNTIVIDTDTYIDQPNPGLNYHDIATGCSVHHNAWTTATLGSGADPGHYPGNVDGSFSLANNNATGSASYSSIFAGPTFTGIDSTAAALTAFAAKSGGALDTASPKIGAVGTYYDFDTGTPSYP
jgi:hypothetical protein